MITMARDNDVTGRHGARSCMPQHSVKFHGIFHHNLNNLYQKTLGEDNFFKSIHIYRIPVEDFLKSCRPIVELSNHAFARHGNEVYHGKA